MQKPTIGRIVIYNALNGSKYPAIIIRTGMHEAAGDDDKDACNLKVFTDEQSEYKTKKDPDDFIVRSCPRGDDPGQWNWPVINK